MGALAGASAVKFGPGSRVEINGVEFLVVSGAVTTDDNQPSAVSMPAGIDRATLTVQGSTVDIINISHFREAPLTTLPEPRRKQAQWKSEIRGRGRR